MNDKLLKQYITEVLKHKKYAGSYPDENYGKGHVNDMLLDEEGWVTDPNDRQEIKKWYINMGLAHN